MRLHLCLCHSDNVRCLLGLHYSLSIFFELLCGEEGGMGPGLSDVDSLSPVQAPDLDPEAAALPVPP